MCRKPQKLYYNKELLFLLILNHTQDSNPSKQASEYVRLLHHKSLFSFASWLKFQNMTGDEQFGSITSSHVKNNRISSGLLEEN